MRDFLKISNDQVIVGVGGKVAHIASNFNGEKHTCSTYCGLSGEPLPVQGLRACLKCAKEAERILRKLAARYAKAQSDEVVQSRMAALTEFLKSSWTREPIRLIWASGNQDEDDIFRDARRRIDAPLALPKWSDTVLVICLDELPNEVVVALGFWYASHGWTYGSASTYVVWEASDFRIICSDFKLVRKEATLLRPNAVDSDRIMGLTMCGFSIEEIAQACGVAVSTASKWAAGSLPRPKTFHRLDDLRAATLFYLMRHPENPSTVAGALREAGAIKLVRTGQFDTLFERIDG